MPTPTLDDAFAEASKNGRVCPNPIFWNELYELLPDRKRVGQGWEPPLPLILAAWWDAPALSKYLRLREHLEWRPSMAAWQVLSRSCAHFRKATGITKGSDV